LGVRLILAHAERYEEFLYDPKLVEEAIAEGCLIQVTTEALADPPSKRDAAAMKSWAQRGMIHVLGSDGHRMDRRLPQLQDGYAVLKGWIGSTAAERIGSLWGTAVLQGLPVNPPPPKPDGGNKSWFSRLLS
jgi:protein-tyrosine phosphatase